ncbi:hypothetical protein KAX02_08145 [candidate division WOR-3 bacterium]|nr:hypothetical protein [candidate division WOR-3 bacterium]
MKKEIKAKFVRSSFEHGSDGNIEVTLKEGGKLHLFLFSTEPTFEYRCNQMSPNERKDVIAQCENQIDSYDTGECPTIFRQLLNRLKMGE